MKKLLLIFISVSSLIFTSCDEGDITEEQVVTTSGRTLKIAMNITGIESWPSSYTVAVAGFTDGNKYANISKNIQASMNDTLVLEGISDNVATLEICVINKLRERVATFYEYDCSQDNNDTIVKDAGTIDARMFAVIQDQIFTPVCARCHGLSGSAAADLFLTDGNSYSNLIDQASTKVEGKTRVIPGNADESLLNDVVTGVDSILSFNHSNIIPEYKTQALITKWINNGAIE